MTVRELVLQVQRQYPSVSLHALGCEMGRMKTEGQIVMKGDLCHLVGNKYR
jgi:hypothetical protein